MIKLCTDPTCDENSALTLQTQLDVAPVPYCQKHGTNRMAALDQQLISYRLVNVPDLPPSELELAHAQIAELQEQLGPSDGPKVPALQEQLERALHTLEAHSKLSEAAQADLAERNETIRVLRLELARQQKELERLRGSSAAPAPAPAAPITPPPTTRPDPQKP